MVRLGRRARLRIVAGPRGWLPAFEVGVVNVRLIGEGATTQIELRPRKRWRWWTVAVRAPVGLVSVIVDMLFARMAPSGGFLTRLAADADKRGHEQQEAAHALLQEILARYLRERTVGELGEDPFRRSLPG